MRTDFEVNIEMILRQTYKVSAIVTREEKVFTAKTKLNTKEYSTTLTPNGLNSSIMAREFIDKFHDEVQGFRSVLPQVYGYTNVFSGSKKDIMFMNDVYKESGKELLSGHIQFYGGDGSFFFDFDSDTKTLREDAYEYVTNTRPDLML